MKKRIITGTQRIPQLYLQRVSLCFLNTYLKWLDLKISQNLFALLLESISLDLTIRQEMCCRKKKTKISMIWLLLSKACNLEGGEMSILSNSITGWNVVSAVGEAQINPTKVHGRNSQESFFPHKSSYRSTKPSSRFHVTSKWSNVKLKSVNIYQKPTKTLYKPMCLLHIWRILW